MSEPVIYPEDPLDRVERLEADYCALAHAYCRLKGIAPDELISDAGHEAWTLVAHAAVREERGIETAARRRK